MPNNVKTLPLLIPPLLSPSHSKGHGLCKLILVKNPTDTVNWILATQSDKTDGI